MKKLAKPHLSLGQIFIMCVGFLGIQFGFALQNGNAIYAIVMAGVFFIAGAISVLWIRER